MRHYARIIVVGQFRIVSERIIGRGVCHWIASDNLGDEIGHGHERGMRVRVRGVANVTRGERELARLVARWKVLSCGVLYNVF